MTYVFIHGAFSSSLTFAFLLEKLKLENVLHLSYNRNADLDIALDEMRQTLTNREGPLIFVGHSLGGIFALRLAECFGERVKGCISIATPFGGSEIAVWARVAWPSVNMFKFITPRCKFMRGAASTKISVPWIQVVTTRGDVDWLPSPNDGVVSRSSMTCRSDVEYVYMEHSHSEVLMTEELVKFMESTFAKYCS